MPYSNIPKPLWPKMEKCVQDVKAKSPGVNAYAICYNQIMGRRSAVTKAVAGK